VAVVTPRPPATETVVRDIAAEHERVRRAVVDLEERRGYENEVRSLAQERVRAWDHLFTYELRLMAAMEALMPDSLRLDGILEDAYVDAETETRR
jgi:hypothetical protein